LAPPGAETRARAVLGGRGAAVTVLKVGALTVDELLASFEAATDRAYNRPLLDAGDGEGLEAWSQLLWQLARASRAVDVTTQALFILPSSAQTNPPAAGAARALVTLTLARTKRLNLPLVIGAGEVFFEEEAVDMGVDGAEPYLTGRRYTLVDDFVFHAGDAGPFDVPAISEGAGYGPNNPMPRSIRVVAQPGAGFTNNLAIVSTIGPLAPSPTATSAQVFVQADNEPDMFVPEHVGQYVLQTAGTNAGNVGRVRSFTAPDLTVAPIIGSKVQVELTQAFEATVFAGTFTPGETIKFAAALTFGRVVGTRVVAGKLRVTFVLLSGGPFATGNAVLGTLSGATATVATPIFQQLYVAEPLATASWRVMDWGQELGLTVTNALAPSGGLIDFLDALGEERGLPRAVSEDDETYRQRISQVADVVTPNAIRRTLNRVMGAYPWCFREVGLSALPGWFFDGDNSAVGGLKVTTLSEANKIDAYDTDVVLFTGTLASGTFVGTPTQPDESEAVVLENAVSHDVILRGYFGRLTGGVLTFIRKDGFVPTSFTGLRIRGLRSGAIFNAITLATAPSTAITRRFRVVLSYDQFRAFFLVGVPRFGFGEFGFPYDVGTHSAYDAAPYLVFFDGYAVTAAAFYQRIWQAIESVKAAGVGFELYIEDIACP